MLSKKRVKICFIRKVPFSIHKNTGPTLTKSARRLISSGRVAGIADGVSGVAVAGVRLRGCHGYNVHLYSDKNYQGKKLLVTSVEICLNKEWSNMVLSVKIDKQEEKQTRQ